MSALSNDCTFSLLPSRKVANTIAEKFSPTAAASIVALLPQFTRRDAGWSVSTQIVALGLLHMINCASVYSVVGVGSKAVLAARPKAARTVSQLSGATMILVAVILFAEQFYPLMR